MRSTSLTRLTDKAVSAVIRSNLFRTMMLDNSSERSLEFSERLFNRYGFRAEEVSAKYYEAALLIVEALRSGEVELTLKSRNDDRRKIRDWLARQANPSQAITGLTRPIYFILTRTNPLFRTKSGHKITGRADHRRPSLRCLWHKLHFHGLPPYGQFRVAVELKVGRYPSELVAFLTWAETEGKKMARELNFAPLPENVQSKVLAQIWLISSGG